MLLQKLQHANGLLLWMLDEMVHRMAAYHLSHHAFQCGLRQTDSCYCPATVHHATVQQQVNTL